MRGISAILAAIPLLLVADGVKFTPRQLDSWRAEAVAVADFNGDGRLDVLCGPYVYLAPDFARRKIRDVKSEVDDKGNGYAEDFMNHPCDVNGDGRVDVVSAAVRGAPMWWNENVLPSDALWPKHSHSRTIGFCETGYAVDLDGDGRNESFVTDPLSGIYSIVDGSLVYKDVKVGGFGTGCGDLLGTGTNGLVAGNSFWEPIGGKWKRHELAIEYDDNYKTGLGHRSNVAIYDVNADGRADLIFASAHKHGIFWFEQLPEKKDGKMAFRRHAIDESWTQAHNPAFADIDGDGVPELIAGKRWKAHCGSDPDSDGEVGIWYYDFTPSASPVFSKHCITHGGDCTSALNIVPVDIDGDGDLDLVTTSKKGGPWILINESVSRRTVELPPYLTEDFDAVCCRAKEENKCLLVSLGREVCGRCQKFYGFVKNGEVAFDPAKYVFVRLDVDNFEHREYFLATFSPADRHLPYVGVMNGDREALKPVLSGGHTAAEYSALVGK